MSCIDSSSIGRLTDYMFVPDRVLEADATIVLGMTLWERPLQKAIELHQSKQAGVLVFSGGYNPRIDGCEALKMRDEWIRQGYPENRLLVDAKSANTLENMANARRLLAKHGLLRCSMHINIISISYHMRRAVETFRAVFGSELNPGIANYPSKYCDPVRWFEDSDGRALLLGEAMKIRKYFPERAPLLDGLLAAWHEGRPASSAAARENAGV